jgi:hypothetical protein
MAEPNAASALTVGPASTVVGAEPVSGPARRNLSAELQAVATPASPARLRPSRRHDLLSPRGIRSPESPPNQRASDEKQGPERASEQRRLRQQMQLKVVELLDYLLKDHKLSNVVPAEKNLSSFRLSLGSLSNHAGPITEWVKSYIGGKTTEQLVRLDEMLADLASTHRTSAEFGIMQATVNKEIRGRLAQVVRQKVRQQLQSDNPTSGGYVGLISLANEQIKLHSAAQKKSLNVDAAGLIADTLVNLVPDQRNERGLRQLLGSFSAEVLTSLSTGSAFETGSERPTQRQWEPLGSMAKQVHIALTAAAPDSD